MGREQTKKEQEQRTKISWGKTNDSILPWLRILTISIHK